MADPFDRYLVRRFGEVPPRLRYACFTAQGEQEARGAAADLNAGKVRPESLFWSPYKKHPRVDEWCVVDTELTREP